MVCIAAELLIPADDEFSGVIFFQSQALLSFFHRLGCMLIIKNKESKSFTE